MQNILFKLLLFVFFISYSSVAQNNLTFDFDYAMFKDEGIKVYLELYYAFSPNELIFKEKSPSKYEAIGRFKLDVINQNSGNTIASKDYRVPVELNDTSAGYKDFKLTGQLNMLLDSGSYLIKINASDFYDSAKSFSAEEEINLKPFDNDKFSISTIELASSIIRSNDENNLFYKNTLEVTPNPSNLFGNNLNKLYYYVELYNINSQELGSEFSVTASIANQEGTEIKSSTKKYKVTDGSKAEFGSLDISGLESNRYILFIKIFDSSNIELLRAYKYFYIYNSDAAKLNENTVEFDSQYLLSEYPKMTDEQIDEEFKKSVYLLSDKHKKNYESLKSIDEKKMFMFKFWKSIEKVITKKEYFSRIDYASKNFKSDFREGWKTDRGRIYAIYGKYDDIERFPYQGFQRAYEIWTYNYVQGGVIFVFMDNSAGFGDFILIHSTAQNEYRDDNWKERLNIY